MAFVIKFFNMLHVPCYTEQRVAMAESLGQIKEVINKGHSLSKIFQSVVSLCCF